MKSRLNQPRLSLFGAGLGLSLLLASCGSQTTVPAQPGAGQPSAGQPAAPVISGDHIERQLIVGLQAGASAEEVAALLGARVVDVSPRLNAALLELPTGQALAKAAGLLRSSPLVRYAEPNYVATRPASPQSSNPLGAQSMYGGLNDPEIGYQWFLRNMKAEEAWKKSTGKGVRIGVADEDIDRHHPDLAANMAYPGFDAPNKALITPETPHDGVGEHGTWVAGTAAAVGNNGIGGAGVAPDAKVVPLTITHSDSGASYWDSANAFVWSVTGPDGKVAGEAGDGDTPAGHKGYVDVLNYSFGGDNYSQILREGIQFVLQHGVVFVTSAGNTPTAGSGSAAWVPGVVSVAATTATDTRTTFSNRGGHLSVAAPGENIWVPGTRVHTADPSENNYAYVNGTSFAGPATAGAAALILSAAMKGGPVNLTPAQVRHILEDTAYSPTGGYTTDLGYGVVRADRAVDMALNDAPNRVEKGASLDMRFVAQSDPSVGIPLVGVTLKGSERRPDQLLYGQSSAGEFVYPSGHASFYEIDAGDYQLFASGPRPILTGITPGSSVARVSLAPGERRTLGDQAGVPLDVELPADPYEPNNAAGQATPIAYGQAVEAVMSERDTDLYRFSAQAGETAFVNTQTLLGSPNLKLRVLAASGTELAANTSFRSGLRDAALKFQVPASGEYLIEVTDEGVGGAFNTYLLGVTQWKGVAPEQNEAGRVSGETFSGVDWTKATAAAVGEAYEATLATNADVDTFRLSARADQTLAIDTLAHGSGSPDLVLGLFNAQGQLLASNDDFTSQDSLVTFKVPSDGEYFVAAASYNGESKGTYTISFMQEAAQ